MSRHSRTSITFVSLTLLVAGVSTGCDGVSDVPHAYDAVSVVAAFERAGLTLSKEDVGAPSGLFDAKPNVLRGQRGDLIVLVFSNSADMDQLGPSEGYAPLAETWTEQRVENVVAMYKTDDEELSASVERALSLLGE
jgi:hypothetical protein